MECGDMPAQGPCNFNHWDAEGFGMTPLVGREAYKPSYPVYQAFYC